MAYLYLFMHAPFMPLPDIRCTVFKRSTVAKIKIIEMVNWLHKTKEGKFLFKLNTNVFSRLLPSQELCFVHSTISWSNTMMNKDG